MSVYCWRKGLLSQSSRCSYVIAAVVLVRNDAADEWRLACECRQLQPGDAAVNTGGGGRGLGSILPLVHPSTQVLIGAANGTASDAQHGILCHADSCNLEMQLYTEEVEAEAWAALPPTGALRNLALKLADSEVLLSPIAHQK